MITIRKPNENEIREFETWPVWEKEESEFDWEYSDKETCYILQGKAQVFDENGAILVEFGKGDLVVFPPGLRCKWKILENMRKHYNLG
ncbi:MAG: cupin domain-containing protein [Thermoplasmatales archaeon]|nr:cupin domain-containing protein [Thermoplasmatales archaeon]